MSLPRSCRVVWAQHKDGKCSDQVGEYKLGTATPMRCEGQRRQEGSMVLGDPTTGEGSAADPSELALETAAAAAAAAVAAA